MRDAARGRSAGTACRASHPDQGLQEALARQIIVSLQHLLQGDPQVARAVLRGLLTEAIVVTPVETEDGIVFQYRGTGRLDPIIGQIRDATQRIRRSAKTVSKANTTKLVAPGDSEGRYTVPFTAEVAAA